MYRPITNFLKTAAILAVMLLASPVAGQQQAGGGIVLSDELNQQLDFMLGKGQLLMAMDRPSEEELAERLELLADVLKKRDAGTLTEEEVMTIKEVFTEITVKAITYWECNIGMDKEACAAIKNGHLEAYKKGLEEDDESKMSSEYIATLMIVEFDECTDCNLWQTPNGQLIYASRSEYTLDQNGQLLFEKLDVVYYILKDGVKYKWNTYLEAYYDEEGERYATTDPSWYNGAILGLGEIGKDMLDPQTYRQMAEGGIKLGFAMILGGNSASDLGIGLGPVEYKQLYSQMIEWDGQDWSKFFVKVTYGAISSYAGSTLINSAKWSRVGSWMPKPEYDEMMKVMKAQPRKGDMHHILLDGPDGFRKQAKTGWVYAEYDIPANTFIGKSGGDGWGIVFGENSTFGKFYLKKGYEGIGMPKVKDVIIIETK